MRRCMNSPPAGQIYTGYYSPGPASRSPSSHQSLTSNSKTSIRSKSFRTRTPQEPLHRQTCAHTWWWKGLRNRYVSAINVAIAQAKRANICTSAQSRCRANHVAKHMEPTNTPTRLDKHRIPRLQLQMW